MRAGLRPYPINHHGAWQVSRIELNTIIHSVGWDDKLFCPEWPIVSIHKGERKTCQSSSPLKFSEEIKSEHLIKENGKIQEDHCITNAQTAQPKSQEEHLFKSLLKSLLKGS